MSKWGMATNVPYALAKWGIGAYMIYNWILERYSQATLALLFIIALILADIHDELKGMKQLW